MTEETNSASAVARERLLATLPDIPRWVELRSTLLEGAGAIFGPPEACAVATEDEGPGSLIAVVGFPEPRWLRAAAQAHPSFEVVGPREVRAHVERLAREPAVGATLHLLRAGRARAALDGRDFVIPDDMQALALPVLAHRLLPSAEAVVTQQPPERVLAAIVEHLPLPQLR